MDETLDGRTAQNGTGAAEDPKWVLPETSKDGLESVTRDVHLSMTVRLLRAELTAIEAEAELKKLNRQLENLENEMKQPESSATESGASEGTNSPESGQNEAGSVSVPEAQKTKDPKETAKRIQETKAKTLECEEALQQVSVLRRQNELLCRYVGDSDANNILKRVQYWQNFINYLLYIVFICNAFITGLGVSGGQPTGNYGGNGTTNALQ